MNRAAYTVTGLKKRVVMTMKRTSTEKKANYSIYLLKESFCQKFWQRHKMLLLGLNFEFSAPKRILNGIVVGGSASQFVQKLTKTFIKSREKKGVNNV